MKTNDVQIEIEKGKEEKKRLKISHHQQRKKEERRQHARGTRILSDSRCAREGVAPRRNNRIKESATKENREVQINAKNGLSIPETNGRTTRRKEKTKKEGEHGERHKNVGNGLVVLLYVLRSWYK